MVAEIVREAHELFDTMSRGWLLKVDQRVLLRCREVDTLCADQVPYHLNF